MRKKILITFLLFIILIFSFTISTYASSYNVSAVPEDVKSIVINSEHYNSTDYEYLCYHADTQYTILSIKKDSDLKFYISKTADNIMAIYANKLFNGYVWEYSDNLELKTSTSFTNANWSPTGAPGYIFAVNSAYYVSSSFPIYENNTFSTYFYKRR